MQAIRNAAQEAAEDIFFGQAVIIWARWFVIAAVTVMMLWSSAKRAVRLESRSIFLCM